LTSTVSLGIIESMLIIRLQRVGKKNQAAFRVVLAEKHRAAKKKAVEILGHYNPRTKVFGVRDPARVKYWIEQHVQVSDTVRNLLIDKELMTGKKVKAWRPKKRKTAEASAEKRAKAESKEGVETIVEEKPEESPKSEAPVEKKVEAKANEKNGPEAKEETSVEAKKEEDKQTK